MNVGRFALILISLFFLTHCASDDRLSSIFINDGSNIIDTTPTSEVTIAASPSPSPRGCQPDYVEATGVLDTSYNQTGRKIFDNAGYDRTYANPVVTSDCKILDAFYYQGTNTSVVVKLNLDGTLDSSFGMNGVAVGFVGYTVGGLLLLPDGRFILVASTSANLKFSRFLRNGTLDTSYNPAPYNFSGASIVTALELNSDGGFYVTFDQHIINKFDANGALDTSFGNAGSLDTGLVATGWYHTNGLLLDNQGRITVGGNNGQHFTLKRYSSSGVLDTTFGNMGTTTVQVVGTTDSHIASLKFAPNGKIVAMGTPTLLATGASLQYAFARFSANGILDTTFGNLGTIVSGSGGRHPSSMRNIQIDQVTGKIYAAAYHSGWQNWRLERFNTNGSVDTSFATNGYFESNLGPGDGPNFVLTSWGKIFASTGSMFTIYTWLFK